MSKREIRYFMYTPGKSSCMWDEFYKKDIMGIAWDEMEDLTKYASKETMKIKLKQLYGDQYSYTHIVHTIWQFVHDLYVGDIVYVKKGLHTIIGRGIVESEYIFDKERVEYKHIHKIRWTHKGEWTYQNQGSSNRYHMLFNITAYTELIQNLELLFWEEEELFLEEERSNDAKASQLQSNDALASQLRSNDTSVSQLMINEKEPFYEEYTMNHFLSEVFMEEKEYNTLTRLLKVKKNLILQGAPGVGKTYLAKRLAYSMIGRRDTSRVMMVQFHQSYSYEDFILGYRPTEHGFELKAGSFYQFCKIAEEDDEHEYFFLIDEINRGNLSKIFGELLMLIEKEKRGEKLRLLYSNELFFVPENVYLIGMMNTADRSLAMIDYALRRRFAFYEMRPAFDSKGFQAMIERTPYDKLSGLVEEIKALNECIRKDDSLGSGFLIGHSYLCTNEVITEEWLSSLIEFELIPLIYEYWFDEKSKATYWANRLQSVM